MVICGLKVSHDGGVAVIDGNRLVFSAEVEKLGNRPRYSALADLDHVAEILRAEGIDPSEVDRFVVDGWYRPAGEESWLATAQHGRPVRVPVATYVTQDPVRGPLQRRSFAGIAGSVLRDGYASYPHVSNHILGAYCTSPFALRGEDALVLAWDGGMLPWLYDVDARRRAIEPLGPLFPLVGNMFGDFSAQLEPYRRDTDELSESDALQHELEVPGKAMAYAALGSVDTGAFAAFDALLDELNTISRDTARRLGREVAARRDELFPGWSSADLIATFQAYLGRMLVESLEPILHRAFRGHRPNLCFGGGCALNIKWNSLLRASGLFAEVWVPPFPNDAGAAIGTACCEMVLERNRFALDWDVYSGPALDAATPGAGWRPQPCDERSVAELLHRTGEPVVVLHGRAELGPRALGNRSILAPAVDPSMKDRLNAIKGRAEYRPVAPICLESHASDVFAPGGADRYMVFEHRLRPGWAERIPAIVHLDGTARLQTIDRSTPGTRTGRILSEYERLSGIPVLCNTSANLGGHGFFGDAAVAAEWGRCRYIWAHGTLYEKAIAVSGVA